MNFANLKKSSGSMEKLTKAVEALAQSDKTNKDENYWKAETDKAGNGYAVIRFLPAPAVDGEDGLPWVKYWDHGFQGPGGWYIENSLTTLGQQDPVSELNSQLWATGIEANKQIARNQKRRLHYVSNIYVVEDPKHPENNGKVFKYKYGTKIFEKLTSAMNPEFADETPLNPFDLWKGANFKLKIRKVEGFQNYDKSEFESPSALLDDDSELEAIWKSEYSLKDVIDPKNYKPYDELKARLDRVLGDKAPAKTTVEAARSKPRAAPVEEEVDLTTNLEEEGDLEYFSKLADQE
jgi:hypothetical protein